MNKRYILNLIAPALADYLTRRGVAVLRVDDRGVGGSTAQTQSTVPDQRDRLASEYVKIEETFAPVALKTNGDWILARGETK
jgi:hypothetical protein